MFIFYECKDKNYVNWSLIELLLCLGMGRNIATQYLPDTSQGLDLRDMTWIRCIYKPYNNMPFEIG